MSGGAAGWVAGSQFLEQTGGGWREDVGPVGNQGIDPNGVGKRQLTPCEAPPEAVHWLLAS